MPRQIAPRLASGESRINWGGRLPSHVKAALRVIARDEKKSMSWVMEEVVIDYFSLKRPKYRSRKVA
jgi:predicted transcriptional regulator